MLTSFCLQDEPELVVSSLWHTAAVHATTPLAKLQAYQHAIQSLKVCPFFFHYISPTVVNIVILASQSDLHPWIKVNYLIELGEWLYQENRFSLQDALDQFQHAVYILLRIKAKPEAMQGEEGQAHCVMM